MLLNASVTNKRAKDEGICDGSREQYLYGGQEGAIRLAPISIDYRGNTVEGSAGREEGCAKEQDELNLSLQTHLRADNDRDGEDDQKDISDHIGRPHRKELGIALSASPAWIWHDLPIVAYGVTLGEVGDNHRDKGDEKEPADELENEFVGTSPD